MSGRTGADRALAQLDLRSYEDVLWIGRPVAPDRRLRLRDGLAAALGIGLLLGSAGLSAAMGSARPFIWGVAGAVALGVAWFGIETVDARLGETGACDLGADGTTSPAARLAAWLSWNHRLAPGRDPASTRSVITSHRVGVVMDPRRHDAFYSGGGYVSFLPRIVEVLGASVRSAARSGPNVVLRIHGRGPFGAFVLRCPDDPEGALRAVRRMMTAEAATEPA